VYAFSYFRPASIDEAVAFLKEHEGAKPLSGGMTLVPTLKQRLAAPSHLVDLTWIPEMKGITVDGDILRIGAATPHAVVASSETVAQTIPALSRLAGLIADPQVRNRGTIGGSIANADPSADYPAAVVALYATVHTNKRAIAGDQFFKGLFETALEPGEIIVKIAFPVPKRAGYAKFPNPASRYAVVGVFVADTKEGVRVGVTGAGPSAFRSKDLEAALAKSFTAEAAGAVKIDGAGFNADMHASAEYRAHLVGVMAKRAVAAALGG
jgi:carbon-monoxide dehydrogenase medium subunit